MTIDMNTIDVGNVEHLCSDHYFSVYVYVLSVLVLFDSSSIETIDWDVLEFISMNCTSDQIFCVDFLILSLVSINLHDCVVENFFCVLEINFFFNWNSSHLQPVVLFDICFIDVLRDCLDLYENS